METQLWTPPKIWTPRSRKSGRVISEPEEIRQAAPPLVGMDNSAFASYGPPPYNVLAIPGLMAWYHTGAGLTLSGADVVEWADQGGSGDVNRNTYGTSHKPTWVPANAFFNNYPTIHFSGTTYLDSLSSWSSAPVQPLTIFVVGADNGSGTSQSWIGDRNNALFVGSFSSQNCMYSGSTFVGAGAVGTSTRVLAAEFNGASSHFHLNQLSASATGSPGATNGTGLQIGYLNLTGWAIIGDIAEVIVVGTSLLSGPVFNGVMNYLGPKYGVTIVP